jgi:superfamily II DNA/RNA helicase
VKVSVHAHQQIGTQIQQELIPIEASEDRFVALKSMLGKDDLTKVLVFADTKRMVSRLCKKLNQQGFPSEQIHGDRSQNQRIKALKSFEDGNVRILLATDVAARGLHITDVSHVINYQTPKNLDSYIHRVGRTGRAGKIGTAYTFISA